MGAREARMRQEMERVEAVTTPPFDEAYLQGGLWDLLGPLCVSCWSMWGSFTFLFLHSGAILDICQDHLKQFWGQLETILTHPNLVHQQCFSHRST